MFLQEGFLSLLPRELLLFFPFLLALKPQLLSLSTLLFNLAFACFDSFEAFLFAPLRLKLELPLVLLAGLLLLKDFGFTSLFSLARCFLLLLAHLKDNLLDTLALESRNFGLLSGSSGLCGLLFWCFSRWHALNLIIK